MDKQNYKASEYINPFRAYDNVLNDIKNYNRADTVNMNELEMNKFRHLAGPAFLTSAFYPPKLVRALGKGKEFKDKNLQNRGLEDTLFDLKNNEKGIIIGLANKNIKGNQKNLFDFIFETEIKPNRK